LEPLERASGMVFGRRRAPAPPRPPEQIAEPRAAFEALVLPALRRPPCLVAFSGGRDSSAVLAAASAVARRHGLEPPVPFTLRFGGDPRTAESEWQELVVRHVGARDWITRDLRDELDALGPIGTRCLERFGAYWPPLAHTWVPIFEAARGGSVLGGNGGDEFLSPWRLGRVRRLRRGRLRPNRTDLKALALFTLPGPLRVVIWERRVGLRLPWLTPAANAKVQRHWSRESTTFERDWRENVEWTLDSRYLEVATAIFDALARDQDVLLVEPLRSAPFVRAVAAAAPRSGFPSRTAAMQALFGDVLPRDALSRATKATFTNVPWGPAARAFAASWTGQGVDPELVDVEAARRVWLSERPDFRSLTPLQSAWLATR
jgi:asparagine synthase